MLVDQGVLKGLKDEFQAAIESVAAAANDCPLKEGGMMRMIRYGHILFL